MPRIHITELLHEVARETGFMAAFTNLRTGESCPNESALLAAILADATNLGLSRMVTASQGVTRDQLIWTQDAYVRDNTYRAALATIINAHAFLMGAVAALAGLMDREIARPAAAHYVLAIKSERNAAYVSSVHHSYAGRHRSLKYPRDNGLWR
ncbi:hypothetical protein J2Z50_004917 [Ensifer mexicanus]|nr:hypothetical protein [Sinorhizobium mexicanum]